ncbi:hypothetical protein [Paenibacillus sp. NPDC055715]
MRDEDVNPLFKDSRFIRFFASRTFANIADSIYSIVLLYVACFIGIFVASFLVSVLKKNGITIAVSWVSMGLAIYVFSIVPEMG